MGPEDARVEDVRAWLRKAELELRAAAHEISALRKTHNLEELGRQCVALDATLRALADQAVPLTEYAWKFRCPGESEEPTREETVQALSTARQVYEAILTRVPPKVEA